MRATFPLNTAIALFTRSIETVVLPSYERAAMKTYAHIIYTSLLLTLVLAVSGCPTPAPYVGRGAYAPDAPDPYAIYAEAEYHERKGSSYWMSDKETARKHYARSRELMQEVTALLPSRPLYKGLYIFVSVLYADCCWHLGDHEEAMTCYNDAYDKLMALAGHDRGWQRAAMGLIAAHVVMGEARMCEGRYATAEGLFHRGKDTAAEWVSRTPLHKEGNVMLCWVHLKLVDACILQAKYDLAEQYLTRAEAIVQGKVDITGRTFHTKEGVLQVIRASRSGLSSLRAASGDAKHAKLRRAEEFHSLARRAIPVQDFAIAYAYLKETVHLCGPFLQTGNRSLRFGHMHALQQLGSVAGELRRIDEARLHFAASLRLVEQLLAEKTEPDLVTDASQTRVAWGALEEKAGNLDKARALYGAATVPLEELERKGTLDARGRRTLMFLREKNP